VALVKTGIDEEVGRRYDDAMAKIAAAEKCTPLQMAARIDRDGFFQECLKLKEDPAKMRMAHYAKYLEEGKQQQQQLQEGEVGGVQMDAVLVGKIKKKTSDEESFRMNKFLNRADNEFRVRIGNMKRAKNRPKKVNEARMKQGTSSDGAQKNDVEEDMMRLMDEGERLLNDLSSEY